MINFDSDKEYWQATTAKKPSFFRPKKTKQQRHEERMAKSKATKQRIAEKIAFKKEIVSDNKLEMHSTEYLQEASFCLEDAPPW